MAEALREAAGFVEIETQCDQESSADAQELLFPKLDGILFPIVVANAEVVAPCRWMEGAEVSLTVALNSYYQPMTEENADEVIADVYDFLAGAVMLNEEDTKEPDPVVLEVQELEDAVQAITEKPIAMPVRRAAEANKTKKEPPKITQVSTMVPEVKTKLPPEESVQESVLSESKEAHQILPLPENEIVEIRLEAEVDSVPIVAMADEREQPDEIAEIPSDQPEPPLQEHDTPEEVQPIEVYEIDTEIEAEAPPELIVDESSAVKIDENREQHNEVLDIRQVDEDVQLTQPEELELSNDRDMTPIEKVSVLLEDLQNYNETDEAEEIEVLSELVETIADLSTDFEQHEPEDEAIDDEDAICEQLLELYNELLVSASFTHKVRERAEVLALLTLELKAQDEEDDAALGSVTQKRIKSLMMIVRTLRKTCRHIAAIGRSALRLLIGNFTELGMSDPYTPTRLSVA